MNELKARGAGNSLGVILHAGWMKEPVWIDYRGALALQGRVVALFGGPERVRDNALLESALARPRQLLTYAESAGIVAIATACTAGIRSTHPFTDGNKRTGFALGILFLEFNGYRFSANEDDATMAVIDLASGTLSEAGYTALLQAHARRA